MLRSTHLVSLDMKKKTMDSWKLKRKSDGEDDEGRKKVPRWNPQDVGDNSIRAAQPSTSCTTCLSSPFSTSHPTPSSVYTSAFSDPQPSTSHAFLSSKYEYEYEYKYK